MVGAAGRPRALINQVLWPRLATHERLSFGTELITRRVPYDLGGRGELQFELTGMTARIEFPLKDSDSILQPRFASISEPAE